MIMEEYRMISIGICDDDEVFVNQLETLITKYTEKYNYKTDLQIFTKSQDLLKYIENENNLDLLFLDIELDEKNGIDIGKNIRIDLHNDFLQIVYISAKENYALQLFDIRPLNFLVKPVDYKKVEYIVEEYNRLFNFEKSYFKYHIGKQTYQIDEQSIIYFESIGRKINMITCIGNKEFYGRLSDICNYLNTNSFCEVHKSYIINMRYVLEYCKDKVVMSNQDEIPVSRSMRDKLNEKIIEFEWG